MQTLKDFFHKYIENTLEKAVVADRKVFLCLLTIAVCKGAGIQYRNVYVTARMLKHLYDKKPAEEFLFVINHLHEIVRYPAKIYKNKDGKRGGFSFLKKMGNAEYFCSVEEVTVGKSGEIQIATAFRLRDDQYIKNYTLLWDWGNGSPHRSALDTP